ncbi:F0F1 ATP synthase subunit delta [Alteraurantiacibacter aestuarii]|uniref:F0F1 ATP synthase subunit delta n=1 Tax=Alteraurantiacibacter aestuarii TaxID=650004 RepID=UPI0031DCD72A
MELSAGIKASLAGRYASALFDLASEAGPKDGGVTAVESDLEKLDAALGESAELRALIRNPEVSRGQLSEVMSGMARYLGLSSLTANFLGVLAENRRVKDLPAMIRAFSAIAAAQRGEVNAEVASAHELSAAQLAELEQKLRAREGRTVKLKSRVDASLLGGLVVTIGSKRIDTSIRTRLNNLAQAMKSA